MDPENALYVRRIREKKEHPKTTPLKRLPRPRRLGQPKEAAVEIFSRDLLGVFHAVCTHSCTFLYIFLPSTYLTLFFGVAKNELHGFQFTRLL